MNAIGCQISKRVKKNQDEINSRHDTIVCIAVYAFSNNNFRQIRGFQADDAGFYACRTGDDNGQECSVTINLIDPELAGNKHYNIYVIICSFYQTRRSDE